MQNWNAIKAYYALHHDRIMRSASEWGVSPYSWEVDAGVSLTPIESAMWSDLRMEGAVFYPQYPALGYFLDFANPVAKVAIECDGKAFHKDKAKDALRDAKLAEHGWKVYRFTGSECVKDTQEYYDDNDALVVELAPVRQMVRDIVSKHGLRVGLNRKPTRIGGGA